MTQQTPTAPAGWYPDPEQPGRQRWWDGQGWGPVAPMPTSYASAPSARTTPKGFAVAALIAGILATASSSSPGAFAPLFGLAAIGLGIAGLRQRRGIATAGIVLGAIGLLIFATSMSGSSEQVGLSDPKPSGSVQEEAASVRIVGQTITNETGVEFMVSAVECGAQSAGEGYSEVTAHGQFCVVRIRLANNGTEPASIWVSDITGRIGDATYEAESTVSDLGGERWNADLNPGLAADGILFFDVPPGSKLDTVLLDTGLFEAPVEVAVG